MQAAQVLLHVERLGIGLVRRRSNIGGGFRCVLGLVGRFVGRTERTDTGFDFLIALRDELLVVGIGGTRVTGRTSQSIAAYSSFS